jgi:putative heme-binding domain-containing protein
MQQAPARIQQGMATALAAERTGAELLLALVEQGYASARLLQSAAVNERLQALPESEIADRAAALVAALPPARDETQRLILRRAVEFSRRANSIENGAQVFNRVCAACHQIGGQGSVVGPQLDGIGNRGLERLLEDILDPNRNVDVAFRSTTLVLVDGRIVTGLLRGERGNDLVLINDQGREFTLPLADVDEQSKSNLSHMPENVGTALTPEELCDLLAYLLEQRAEPIETPSQ